MGLFCRIAFFRPRRPLFPAKRSPMFHVKHFCVKGLPSQPAMFHVKHFCVNSRSQIFARTSKFRIVAFFTASQSTRTPSPGPGGACTSPSLSVRITSSEPYSKAG